MSFARITVDKNEPFDTIEEMYNRLPKSQNASSALWGHQRDVLDAYLEHENEPNISIELPTGTGKTLVGLLVANWHLAKEKPVLYAVPTRQLAAQVAQSAKAEGVACEMLVGSHTEWDIASLSKVKNAQSIGITTYSSIFNSHPKVPIAHTVIFDDAHAASQFVGRAYSIEISRDDTERSYFNFLSAIGPHLNRSLRKKLQGERVAGLRDVVTPFLTGDSSERLDALRKGVEGLPDSFKFQRAMVESSLETCLTLLSHDAISIRPMVPPTITNLPFTQPHQRVFLSATLGKGGELERSFGLDEIHRISLSREVRQGRKFYFFPELQKSISAHQLAQKLLAFWPKALVLTQSSLEEAAMTARELGEDSIDVFDKMAMDTPEELARFKEARSGLLALSNRFDGLDFPGDSCRLIVVDGPLNTQNLLERFLTERVGAATVLNETVTTRVLQAVGRCTRNQNDYSAIIILGRDLTLHFSERSFIKALPPEAQAEIEMSWQSSEQSDVDGFIDNLKAFMAQDANWESANIQISTAAKSKKTESVPAVDQLSKSAALEVKAWNYAHVKDWDSGAKLLQEAAKLLNDRSLKGYKGLLLFIAADWLTKSNTAKVSVAKNLRDSAEKVAGGTKVWMKEAFSANDISSYTAEDIESIKGISKILRGQGMKAKAVTGRIQEMIENANHRKSTKFEQSLKMMGELLGAKSFKPYEQSQCDAAWMWGNHLWITLEAKSEQSPQGTANVKDIRQANTQLQALEHATAQSAPCGSVSVLITDRDFPAPDVRSHALPHVFLASTDDLKAIAADVADAWAQVLPWFNQIDETDAIKEVGTVFSGHNVLPSQLRERLTLRPLTNSPD